MPSSACKKYSDKSYSANQARITADVMQQMRNLEHDSKMKFYSPGSIWNIPGVIFRAFSGE
jgi:hypothetical protein